MYPPRVDYLVDAPLDGRALVVLDVDGPRQADEIRIEGLRPFLVANVVFDRPQALVDAEQGAYVGLDVDEAMSILTTDVYAQDVRGEEAEAATIGISGVPFFVFGRRYAVSGAQPADVLMRVLEKSWAENR